MENPATWTEAEHIVSRVLAEHDELQADPEPYCGLSLERRITDALRRAGLLTGDRGKPAASEGRSQP